MSKALLIDGLSILNRAFYGIPDLTNSAGQHTNAVYGFLNTMLKIIDEEQPDYIGVAFDVSAPTFRHQMYADYKGTRSAMPDELREQIPMMKDVLQSMQVAMMELPGYEADDLIGTMSRRCEAAGIRVTILSGDRDLLQLATDSVLVRIPKTRGGQTTIEDYYAADVLEKYQVTPEEFVDLKALMGDASDNIPGVPGIGEKTAAKIIVQWHRIEDAFAHASEIKPKKASENLVTYWEQAKMSKVLAKIDTDCPVETLPEDLLPGDLFGPDAYQMFKKLEFKNLMSRFDRQDMTDTDIFMQAVPTDAAQAAQRLSETDHSMPLGAALIGREPAFLALCCGDACMLVRMDDPDSAMLLSEIAQWPVVCMNDIKSAIRPLRMENRGAASVFDASVAAYLLNPLKDSYTFDDIARDYLHRTLPSVKDLLGKQSFADAMDADREACLKLAGWMASVPLMARAVLLKELDSSGMRSLYEDVELPLIFVLDAMESRGIRVASDELKAYGEALTERIDVLADGIYSLAGEQFNIQSPKQLGVILFEKMHLPYGKKTKTGYSTSAEVLEKLIGYDPIVNMILEYRQLTKLKSTYADGLSAFISPDGRIHGKFNQTITATGRISSTEPNLQNIPVRMELGRRIRKVFVPEEGYIFVDADYSQIELRVLAHMSGDEKLIEAYREAQDIHRLTASQVFHVPLDEVTDQQRRNAKAVNFGIVYGISSFGLSQDLSISRKEASDYIEQYFITYPSIKAFLDGLVQHAKEQGYSLTMYGRRRPVPELSSSNFMQRSFGERIAMNSPIQGTAADIIKIAMVRVERRLRAEGLKSRLILQIHDELLIEAWAPEAERVCRILKEEMEGAASLKVALEVDVHTGSNWLEAK